MQRTERRRQLKEEKKKKSKIRKFFKFVIGTGFVVTMVGVIGASALAIKYEPMAMDIWKDANQKIQSINEGTFKNKTPTVIYDNKGNVIKKLAIHDYYYIDDKDIQPNIKNAVIAIEDVRFFEHKGYDVKAIARALVELIKNKGHITQGGSTITQQLVKVQFLNMNRVYSRKIEEIIIASKLEDMYPKQKILEFYLNNINYGNGAYGIETASRTYFNKPSKDLTLSEIALLTGIPNNPSLYNPVRHMDNALKRRDLILSKMKEYGFITKAQYEEAKKQKIVLNMPKKKYVPETYEVSFALSSATKILMQNEGFHFKYWFNSKEERNKYWTEYNDLFLQLNKKIRNGGFKIYTTIDMDKQAKLQASINRGLSDFWSKDPKTGLYKTQGAGVLIDNQTGDLLAIVGGRTQPDVANTFNRGFLAYRQPGSTIKPLVAYTPAFEKGKLASSVMLDGPIQNGPKNADRAYHGYVTLRKAVEKSYNTIPFKLLLNYGAENMIPYLTKMEFSNLVPEDANPIIAVGGFTYGTTPLEMAGGYATLARNGEYIKPTGIQKMVDVTNTVIYQNEHKRKRVYDSGSAYLMTDVLKGVVKNGTGRGFGLPNMPTAGKTGTTNDNKDAWFAGYTPYYTAVIWVGNDIPKSLNVSGGTYPGRIWKDFMLQIHKGLKPKDFVMPDRISYMYVNPNTYEVDKKNNHGWWRRELVPEIYYELQEKRKEEARLKAEKARLKAEKERLEEERKRLAKIKRTLKEHGITEEEERIREYVASGALDKLEEAHLYSSDDYEYVYGVMHDAKKAIDDVVLDEPRNKLLSRYDKEVDRIEEERKALENPKIVEEPVVEEPVEEDVIPEETNPSYIHLPVPKPNPSPSTSESKPKTQPASPPASNPAPKPVPKPTPKPAPNPVPKPTPKPSPKPTPNPAPKPSNPTTPTVPPNTEEGNNGDTPKTQTPSEETGAQSKDSSDSNNENS